MRALTLIDDSTDNPQPWAWAMEAQLKTDESRTWAVPSTQRPLGWDLLICGSSKSRTHNKGLAVCVVEVYDCVPFTEEYEQTVGCYAYNGWVWRTRNLRWLSRKFAVKGSYGIFQQELPAGVTLYVPTPEQLAIEQQKLIRRYNLPVSSSGKQTAHR